MLSMVYASQVHSTHENARMMPQVFNVEASDRTFTAHVEIVTEVLWQQAMKGTQFPLTQQQQGTSLQKEPLLMHFW